MPQYTPNLQLYKWDKTDSKVDTITEMASNAHKIDTKLKDVDESIAQINTDLTTTTATANDAVQKIEQVQIESAQAVTTSNEAQGIAESANTKSDEAKALATDAKSTADTAKAQLDEVTKASSIDPQVSQALVGSDGKTYANIANRFDAVDALMAQVAINVNSFTGTDTQKIQSAMNHISSIGGGTVLIPKNQTFIIDMITVPSNVVLTGGGTLKFKDNTTFFALLLLNMCENVTIDGIVFDGNNTNQTTWSESRHCIISYSAKNVTIKNCTFKDPIGDGIYLSHNGTSLIQSSDFQIHHNRFIGNNTNRNGISVIHGRDISIGWNYFKGMARSNMPGAIDLEPNMTTEIVENVLVNDNTIIGTGDIISVQNGISLANNYQNGAIIRNVTLTGNMISGKWKYGIALFGDSSQLFTSASVKNNSIHLVETIAETAGILISKGEYDVSENTIDSFSNYGIKIVGGKFKISSNKIKNATKYGIEEIGATDDSGQIQGNIIEDCGTNATNTYGGMHITGSFLTIVNNRIASSDPNKTRMGIYLTSGKKNLIAGNYFRGIGYRDMNINIAPQIFGQNVYHSATANVISGTYPPTSETWTAGDTIIYPLTGNIYICTASGTPGTWKTI